MRDANVRAARGKHSEAVAGYQQALALAEKSRGPDHPVVLEILTWEVDSLVATGDTPRAVSFAERAHRIAAGRGPWMLAEAELALARTLGAKGKDRPRALALAHQARARLEGLGYDRSRHKIDAWLAEAQGELRR